MAFSQRRRAPNRTRLRILRKLWFLRMIFLEILFQKLNLFNCDGVDFELRPIFRFCRTMLVVGLLRGRMQSTHFAKLVYIWYLYIFSRGKEKYWKTPIINNICTYYCALLGKSNPFVLSQNAIKLLYHIPLLYSEMRSDLRLTIAHMPTFIEELHHSRNLSNDKCSARRAFSLRSLLPSSARWLLVNPRTGIILARNCTSS